MKCNIHNPQKPHKLWYSYNYVILVSCVCYMKCNIPKYKKKYRTTFAGQDLSLSMHDRTQKAEYFFHYLLKNKKK